MLCIQLFYIMLHYNMAMSSEFVSVDSCHCVQCNISLSFQFSQVLEGLIILLQMVTHFGWQSYLFIQNKNPAVNSF